MLACVSECGLFVSAQALGMTIEVIFLIHSLVGAIIFIIMSAFAGAALRPTKTQVKTCRAVPGKGNIVFMKHKVPTIRLVKQCLFLLLRLL